MNKQLIAYIIGSIMKIEAALMAIPLIVGLMYKENVISTVEYYPGFKKKKACPVEQQGWT